MVNTKLPQSSKNVFSTRQNEPVAAAAAGVVRQDKGALMAARTATRQPAPSAHRMRPYLAVHRPVPVGFPLCFVVLERRFLKTEGVWCSP